MSKLILGVDGGGTKSHLAFFNENGNCVSSTVYGALNHEGMEGSYDELKQHFDELLPRAVRDAGATINDIKFAVFGIAGIDSSAQQKLISKMVEDIGFKDFIMCNDAVLGVPAGCPDCVGICAINGTGSKLAAIDNSGITIESCGLGAFTNDFGGGSWYGNKAIGFVYDEIYKLGRPTIMKDMIFDLFGITKREDYLDVLVEKTYNGSGDLYSVEMNSVAFNAAEQGDAVALGILEESAEHYAGAIARIIMDYDFPRNKPVYVTLAGSVFVKQRVKLLHDFIKMRVDDALNGQSVEYIILSAPPVAGAVMWAAQKAGFKIEMSSIKAGLEAAGL